MANKYLLRFLSDIIRLVSRSLNFFLRILEMVIAIPFSLPCIILGWVAILCDRYSEVSLLISRIPFYFGEYIRYYYYRATLKRVGRNVVFKYGSFCQYSSARIGDRVLIGYYSALGEVCMGDDIVVGGFVNFLSGTNQHSYEDPSKPIRSQETQGRKIIIIGSDVWIGSNAVIAANVGDRCVIGTGSILVHDAESQCIYAGNPARLVKRIL